MTSKRKPVEEHTNGALKVEVLEITRTTQHLSTVGTPQLHTQHAATGTRQLKFTLSGGGVKLQPGALSYCHGRLKTQVIQHESGGFLRRAARSAGTGESAFATHYSGTGVVYTEPTAQRFLIVEIDNDDLLLDDRIFYACQDTLDLSTHVNRNIQTATTGNGLAQPRVKGSGILVLETDFTLDDIEVIELRDEEMILDGDMMLMVSASLDVRTGMMGGGMRNAARSGEGLVYFVRGTGTVYLTPLHVHAGTVA